MSRAAVRPLRDMLDIGGSREDCVVAAGTMLAGRVRLEESPASQSGDYGFEP